MPAIQPIILKKVSGKWQPHWGGENIEQTCASGEIKIKVRDDRMTAFYISQPTVGTYEVLVNGVSQGTFARNTYYTFVPTLGGGHPDTFSNGYTTYDLTIRAVTGTLGYLQNAVPYNNTALYSAINYIGGALWVVNNSLNAILYIGSPQATKINLLVECVETLCDAYFSTGAFYNLTNLVKVKGNFKIVLPYNTTSNRALFNTCTNLKEVENLTFDKNGIEYVTTCYNCYIYDFAPLINGIYPNATNMAGFIANNYLLSGLDITAPLVDFSNNSFCVSATSLYLRNTNFKSVAVAGTKIVLQYWVNMTEQAWINFANALEDLTGYTSHTIDLRNNLSNITLAVRNILTAKNWTILY